MPGKWTYLYRVLEKEGNTRVLCLADTERQSILAVSRQGANGLEAWEKPEVINTDEAPTYAIAISE